MEYFFIILLLILVCLYICYPFFTKNVVTDLYVDEMNPDSENEDNSLTYLEHEKEHIYGAIKEIDFDYGLGKLSEEDYTDLRQEYIYQAAMILKKIEEQTGKTTNSAADSIEKEIAKARYKSENLIDDIEEEIKISREK